MSRNRVQIGGARERKGDDFLLAWCLAFSGSGGAQPWFRVWLYLAPGGFGGSFGHASEEFVAGGSLRQPNRTLQGSASSN